MERAKRLEAIKEGKFLSLQSDVSVRSSAELHSTEERPFVIPHHDPQGSIATSRYSKEFASAAYRSSESSYTSSEKGVNTARMADSQEPAESRRKSLISSIRLFGNKSGVDKMDHAPANPPPYTSPPTRPPRPSTFERPNALRNSRFSITPSMVATGYNLPDPSNHRDSKMSMITSHEPRVISPMHVVKLPDDWNPDLEPLDSGSLAWMQVLAGFFVIMDAQ